MAALTLPCVAFKAASLRTGSKPMLTSLSSSGVSKMPPGPTGTGGGGGPVGGRAETGGSDAMGPRSAAVGSLALRGAADMGGADVHASVAPDGRGGGEPICELAAGVAMGDALALGVHRGTAADEAVSVTLACAPPPAKKVLTPSNSKNTSSKTADKCFSWSWWQEETRRENPVRKEKKKDQGKSGNGSYHMRQPKVNLVADVR